VFEPDADAAVGPTVSSLDLTTGSTAGGDVVTISGSNFTPDAIAPVVYFGSTRAQMRMFSADQIVVVAPPHEAGVVDVRVITDAGETDINDYDDFTYTPAPPPPAPITGFGPTDSSFTPAIPVANDSNPVEVGVTFSARSGTVTAIQFYRGAPSDSGFDVHLWDRSGNLLATGHAPGKQAPGWQTVDLPFPVHIDFGVYVASYYASSGGYAADQNYQFQSAGPLSFGHGVFRYGSGGGFPTQTYMSSNYWVSPVFQPDASADAAPNVTALSQTTGTPAGGDLVAISGSNFTPDAVAPVVFFGNVKAQVVSFAADQIYVYVPAHPEATVDVRVITDAGESDDTPDDLFTYAL
jgi:hypothetical protein